MKKQIESRHYNFMGSLGATLIVVASIFLIGNSVSLLVKTTLYILAFLIISFSTIGIILFFKPITESEDTKLSQFEQLREILDRLADTEFRDMMNSLLMPQELNRLPLPMDTIDRGDFLGQMKVFGRLDEVEMYLQQKYPERFD